MMLEDVLYRDVDRIVVVGDGTIVCDLTPDELLAGDILMREGIREPLYVTALKHAGCKILPKDHPQHVDTMQFEPYKAQVQSWFANTVKEKPENTNEAVLSIENLNFSYQSGQPVLKNMNLSVKKGEMMAIVGKNGAGKTTLSNLICGFLTPDSGKILLNGADISPLSIKERGERICCIVKPDWNQLQYRVRGFFGTPLYPGCTG